MKKKFLKYSLFVLTAAVFMSCSKDSDDVNPDISGKWFVQSVSTEIEYQNDDPESDSEDLSASGLYLDFDGNGNYTTNGAIELETIGDNNGQISAGTYTYSNGVIGLTYDDPDFEIPVTLFLHTNINGDTMTLNLTKSDLAESLSTTADLDDFTKIFIQLFLEEIVRFDYTMTLSK